MNRPYHSYGRSAADVDRIEIPKVPQNVRLSVGSDYPLDAVTYHFSCPVPGDDVVCVNIAVPRFLAGDRGHVQAAANNALHQMGDAIGRRVMGDR